MAAIEVCIGGSTSIQVFLYLEHSFSMWRQSRMMSQCTLEYYKLMDQKYRFLPVHHAHRAPRNLKSKVWLCSYQSLIPFFLFSFLFINSKSTLKYRLKCWGKVSDFFILFSLSFSLSLSYFLSLSLTLYTFSAILIYWASYLDMVTFRKGVKWIADTSFDF